MLALAGTGYLVEVTIALVGLLAVLALVNRRMRTLGARGDVVALTPQHKLHVVELEGRRLLVGTGPSAAPHLLTELAPAQAEEGASPHGP